MKSEGEEGDLMKFYSLPVEQVETSGQRPTCKAALFGGPG